MTPAPADMPGREYVLGVQANLWTEYIPTAEQAEYMLYPRLFALAEVAWCQPEGKDYRTFRERALRFTELARSRGYNAFDLADETGERPESLEPVEHLAVGCPVTYATRWNGGYPAAGERALTDGLRGSWSYKERWQGFLGCDVDVTVDLGEVKPISEVSADFTQWYSAWIWLPGPGGDRGSRTTGPSSAASLSWRTTIPRRLSGPSTGPRLDGQRAGTIRALPRDSE